MNIEKKAYLQIHFCVFLWGFTAILGRLIELKELPLVWFRVLITCFSMLFLPKIFSLLKQVKKEDFIKLFFIGCLVCSHWVCFYGAIKYSNVSVTLSCLAVTSFITSLLDPLVSKKSIKKSELILGFMIIPGIYLIFFFTQFYLTGIILGLLSALLASIFTIMNKKMVDKVDSTSMTFIELGSGAIFLTLLMPLYLKLFPTATLIPSNNDWLYLLILSLFCTTLPFNLSLKALKHISAFTANFVVNLEPIYGILMAIAIFNENKELNSGFYLGTAIILISIFSQPYLDKRFG